VKHWREQAACLGADPDIFFPTERKFTAKTWRRARAICNDCPVRSECLDLAMSVDATEDRWGMFGGMNPSERREHRRRLGKS
jgi:WhiB family redox-sensing transcriptional regulator